MWWFGRVTILKLKLKGGGEKGGRADRRVKGKGSAGEVEARLG